MCRLLGYVTDHPRSVTDCLGAEGFQSFTALAALHGDGWGAAWQDLESSRTRRVISTRSAADDPHYAELTSAPISRSGLLHLRWASAGLDITPDNTHPFIDGDYALAHNGSIKPITELEELLTPESRERLQGTTDSERYFRYVMQAIDQPGDEGEAVQGAISELATRFPTSSLNALFLTPTSLYAVHVNSSADGPLDDLRELYSSEDEIPHAHAGSYFSMFFRETEQDVMIISSGLPEEGWQPVTPDSIMAVNLQSRELRHLPLEIAVAEA